MNNVNANTDKKYRKKNRKKTIVAAFIITGILTVPVLAWFSLTNTPTVNEIAMSAGVTGALKISLTENGVYGDEINLSEVIPDNVVTRPITSNNGVNFYKPIYSASGVVQSIESTPLSASELALVTNKKDGEGGYILRADFYLLAESPNPGTVAIKLTGSGVPGSDGAYTIITDKNGGDAAKATRISFTANNQTAVVEPLADVSVAGNSAQMVMSGFSSLHTIKQGQNGMFLNTSTNTYSNAISETLFNINTNTKTKVTMYIWIEGSDRDCINDIASDSFGLKIKFYSE